MGLRSVAALLALVAATPIFLAVREARAQEPVCSRSDVLVCDGFESHLKADGVYPGWGWNTGWNPDNQGTVRCLGGSTNPTRRDITQAVDGVDGTTPFAEKCSLYWHASQNAEDGIHPERYFSPQPTQGPVYARFYVKYSPGFRWNDPGAKVFYIRADAGGSFSWGYQLGSEPFTRGNTAGPGRFYIDVGAYHVDRLPYNAGPCAGNANCNEGRIFQGQWYAVEMLLIPNSAKGVKNGVARLWINDVLVSDYSGLDWRERAPSPTANPNGVWISAYIGGPTNPHPAQTIWYDNIVAATKKIGPYAAGPPAPLVPPAAPVLLD
jgi:hypothetical protein